MNPDTCAALVALNREFYDEFAGDFARTRRSWPPGFERILPQVDDAANVLDVGCGNGRFLAFLASTGWTGSYTGIDSSEPLLAEAARLAADHPQIDVHFVQCDLMDPRWPALLASANASPPQYDVIVCLAVLHHIPGAVNRELFLARAGSLLAPGSRLVLSTWQFLTSERLRKRVLPWNTVGIRPEAVEPGDYLVAWGAGAAGHRYCASIDEGEVRALAAAAGLTTRLVFTGDGHEGRLNLYAVLSAR